MFENLSDKLTNTLRKVRGQAKISESNIEEALKEIRLSLLEADVNFKVVKSFLDQVKTKALGAEVLQSLTAGQQFVSIVHNELVETLGRQAEEINIRGEPAVLMLVGLQGVGKKQRPPQNSRSLCGKSSRRSQVLCRPISIVPPRSSS